MAFSARFDRFFGRAESFLGMLRYPNIHFKYHRLSERFSFSLPKKWGLQDRPGTFLLCSPIFKSSWLLLLFRILLHGFPFPFLCTTRVCFRVPQSSFGASVGFLFFLLLLTPLGPFLNKYVSCPSRHVFSKNHVSSKFQKSILRPILYNNFLTLAYLSWWGLDFGVPPCANYTIFLTMLLSQLCDVLSTLRLCALLEKNAFYIQKHVFYSMKPVYFLMCCSNVQPCMDLGLFGLRVLHLVP